MVAFEGLKINVLLAQVLKSTLEFKQVEQLWSAFLFLGNSDLSTLEGGQFLVYSPQRNYSPKIPNYLPNCQP